MLRVRRGCVTVSLTAIDRKGSFGFCFKNPLAAQVHTGD
jgi:hypothetical protein